MRGFDELVDEAGSADVTGWGFDWLRGRATEERPPWGCSRILARRLPRVCSALDLDTGGGEVVADVPVLPGRMVVTESWPPNAERARGTLEPRGVTVVETASSGRLPSDDGTFDLVTSRHPVQVNWPEIARVLTAQGRYTAQHVGPGSAFDLIDRFVGTTPEQFHDVGAVVYVLRTCVWWVPGFDARRYETELRRIDALIRAEGCLVAHSTRHLVEARPLDGTGSRETSR